MANVNAMDRNILVTQILLTAASESTVHGLCRLGGQRPLYVKLCWLVAFLALFAVFSFTMFGFTRKLVNGEISTSYEAEAVDFEFPDVYFCNSVQISGTYSVTLPDSVVSNINTRMGVTSAAFDWALQRVLNTSMRNATSSQVDQMKLYRLKSAIQSMPYKLLVDQLGHKEQQMVLKNDSRSGVILKPFYHPNHLKCLKVQLSEERRTELSKVNSQISFQFLLDPHFTDFNSILNVTAFRQVNSVTVPLYNNLTIFVYDWDLDTPYEIDRPMGMRLYLAPRGEYPSRFATNFLLAPGRSYSIGLTMQNIVKDADTFQGSCLTDVPEVAFLNPYDGSAYPFNYSNSFCYFSEFARQLAQNGCSPYVNPLPWQHKDLRFCLNFTGQNASDIPANLAQAITADASVLNDYQAMCQSRQLCVSRQYTTSTSSANWPNENGQIRVITDLMRAAMDATPGVSRPSWDAAHGFVFNEIFNYPKPYLGAEIFAAKFFSRSGLKVTLKCQESRSSQIRLSSGYSLPAYIADIGGTAGIYIGCSLLSVCELVELVHDLVVKRRGSTAANVVSVQMSTGSVP